MRSVGGQRGVGVPWEGGHGHAGAQSVCASVRRAQNVPSWNSYLPFAFFCHCNTFGSCSAHTTTREAELCSWSKLVSYYRRVTTVVCVCVFL